MSEPLIFLALMFAAHVTSVVARSSKLTAMALAVPLAANMMELRAAESMAQDHPARVVVPLASAALAGIAAAREGRCALRVSRACALGVLTCAFGLTDALAPKYFVVYADWFPLWFDLLGYGLLLVVATRPERMFACSPS